MHRAAYHFIKALGIGPLRMGIGPLRMGKRKRQAKDDEGDVFLSEEGDALEGDDEADIDVSMDIDASADDPDAMGETLIIDFEPGDTLGKLLAFVNQVQMSSEGVREYLTHFCIMHGIKPIELRLWVRSRWGSLSDCLKCTLHVQKVSIAASVCRLLIYVYWYDMPGHRHVLFDGG